MAALGVLFLAPLGQNGLLAAMAFIAYRLAGSIDERGSQGWSPSLLRPFLKVVTCTCERPPVPEGACEVLALFPFAKVYRVDGKTPLEGKFLLPL